MAKQKNETKTEMKHTKEIETSKNLGALGKCADPKCPFHGALKLRGRIFRGNVISKFPKRVAIEFERTVFIQKYERYAKSKTKLHARLPDCLANEIQIGDYIEIQECRQLSKIIAFVVTKKIRSASEDKNKSMEETK